MAGHSTGRTVFYRAESETAGSKPVSGHIPVLRRPAQVDGPNTHPRSPIKFLNIHTYIHIHIHFMKPYVGHKDNRVWNKS